MQNFDKVVYENCYLYEYLQNGEMVIRVVKMYYNPKNKTKYQSKDVNDDIRACSREQGSVYNNLVWFATRSDKLALMAFIAYEFQYIKILQDGIRRHESNARKLSNKYVELETSDGVAICKELLEVIK